MDFPALFSFTNETFLKALSRNVTKKRKGRMQAVEYKNMRRQEIKWNTYTQREREGERTVGIQIVVFKVKLKWFDDFRTN